MGSKCSKGCQCPKCYTVTLANAALDEQFPDNAKSGTASQVSKPKSDAVRGLETQIQDLEQTIAAEKRDLAAAKPLDIGDGSIRDWNNYCNEVRSQRTKYLAMINTAGKNDYESKLFKLKQKLEDVIQTDKELKGRGHSSLSPPEDSEIRSTSEQIKTSDFVTITDRKEVLAQRNGVYENGNSSTDPSPNLNTSEEPSNADPDLESVANEDNARQVEEVMRENNRDATILAIEAEIKALEPTGDMDDRTIQKNISLLKQLKTIRTAEEWKNYEAKNPRRLVATPFTGVQNQSSPNETMVLGVLILSLAFILFFLFRRYFKPSALPGKNVHAEEEEDLGPLEVPGYLA